MRRIDHCAVPLSSNTIFVAGGLSEVKAYYPIPHLQNSYCCNSSMGQSLHGVFTDFKLSLVVVFISLFICFL